VKELKKVNGLLPLAGSHGKGKMGRGSTSSGWVAGLEHKREGGGETRHRIGGQSVLHRARNKRKKGPRRTWGKGKGIG